MSTVIENLELIKTVLEQKIEERRTREQEFFLKDSIIHESSDKILDLQNTINKLNEKITNLENDFSSEKALLLRNIEILKNTNKELNEKVSKASELIELNSKLDQENTRLNNELIQLKENQNVGINLNGKDVNINKVSSEILSIKEDYESRLAKAHDKISELEKELRLTKEELNESKNYNSNNYSDTRNSIRHSVAPDTKSLNLQSNDLKGLSLKNDAINKSNIARNVLDNASLDRKDTQKANIFEHSWSIRDPKTIEYFKKYIFNLFKNSVLVNGIYILNNDITLTDVPVNAIETFKDILMKENIISKNNLDELITRYNINTVFRKLRLQ